MVTNGTCNTNVSSKCCPVNYSKGGCGSSNTCCKELTEFQQTLQQARENIEHYNLKKRLLTDRFKNRPRSKCDTSFKKLSKASFEAKCCEIESQINANKKAIKNAKLGRASSNRVHDPDGSCTTCAGSCGTSCCCKSPSSKCL